MDEEYKILLVEEQGDKSIDEIWSLLNANGISPSPYESLVDARWFEELRFCGCGIPEEVQEYIRNVLDAMAERSNSRWQVDNVDSALLADPEAIKYFVLYILDAMKLTEHGTSVGGSWLTEAGEKLLREMRGKE